MDIWKYILVAGSRFKSLRVVFSICVDFLAFSFLGIFWKTKEIPCKLVLGPIWILLDFLGFFRKQRKSNVNRFMLGVFSKNRKIAEFRNITSMLPLILKLILKCRIALTAQIVIQWKCVLLKCGQTLPYWAIWLTVMS